MWAVARGRIADEWACSELDYTLQRPRIAGGMSDNELLAWASCDSTSAGQRESTRSLNEMRTAVRS
jgi:predicted NAD/FAD-dependent oxidoreductase